MDDFPNIRVNKDEHIAPLPGSGDSGGIGGMTPPSPSPGLFDEEPETKAKFIKEVLPALVMIIAVVGLGVLGWYAYKEAHKPANPEEVPIIKADSAPYKIKPDNPGGMEFANTDKAIYDMISDNNKPAQNTENVLEVAQPEEPMARDALMPEGVLEETKEPAPLAAATTAPVEKTVEPTPTATPAAELEAQIEEQMQAPVRKRVQDIDAPEKTTTEEVIVVKEEPVAPKKITAVPATPTIPAEPAAPKKIEEVVKTPAAPAAPKVVSDRVERAAKSIPKSMQKQYAEKGITEQSLKAVQPVASGKYRIQLGAYRSDAAAGEAWGKLKSKHAKELGALDKFVEKANLGSKGIFYRLQAGPFKNEDDARLVCKKLVAKQQGCLAVGG